MSNCTLRCYYCYVTIHQTFGQSIPNMLYSPAFVRRALSKERLGGCCHLNFCANGETLLFPKLVEYVEQLLEEGHYISIVTNCTLSKHIAELTLLRPELKKHLFVKASYHYLELKEKGLLDTFFNNVCRLHDAGISLTLEITPNDGLIPFVEEAVELCHLRMGAAPHFTVARDERDKELPLLTSLTREEYRKVWGRFNSALFDFKESIFGRPIKKFCYAGEWFLCLDLLSGHLSQCYGTPGFQNIYDNPDEPINYNPIGKHCPRPHCFNGHALLTQGVVPGEEGPTYAATRDRVMDDGSHWLYKDVKEFFSQKLYNNNKQYSFCRRFYIDSKPLLQYLYYSLKGH